MKDGVEEAGGGRSSRKRLISGEMCERKEGRGMMKGRQGGGGGDGLWTGGVCSVVG